MVVGYQTKNTVAGFNFIAPTFENVAEGGVDIQDIKLSEGAAEYSDNIQLLDVGGATTEMYLYTADGWIDADTFELANKKIKAGVSVLINTENSITVTLSGKVGTEKYETTSEAGFNFVGNTTPVAINIQDVKLEGQVSEYSDNIQILDKGGATSEMYLYTADGWIDADTFELANKTIDSGLGLLVNTENAGVKITVPPAL